MAKPIIQNSDLNNPFSSLEKENNGNAMVYSNQPIDEKIRRYTVFTSDVAWTINKQGQVSYIYPFVENCIGNDVELVIKNIASKYLSLPAVISCLIEMEEIKSIVSSGYRMEPRKLFLETLLTDEKCLKLEVTTYASYDSMHNFIGLTGTCHQIS